MIPKREPIAELRAIPKAEKRYPREKRVIYVTDDKICYTFGYNLPHRSRDGSEPEDDENLYDISIDGDLYNEGEPTEVESETIDIDVMAEIYDEDAPQTPVEEEEE